MDNSSPSRSWFAVFNNPQEHGYSGTPDEICERIVTEYVGDSLTRSCACSYCVSPSDLHHLHIVYEDTKAMRFSAIKKIVPYGVHLEPTRGSKEDAVNYILKKGKYAESGEQVITHYQIGEIKANKGKSKILENIDDFINRGYSPADILASGGAAYYKERELINKMYIDRLNNSIPYVKLMTNYYHVGDSGSGKSYSSVLLREKYGDNKVFFVSDYSKGFLDDYLGEPVVVFDDIKTQVSLSDLLRYSDVYKVPVHCRYANKFALWTEFHLTSVFPPDILFSLLCDTNSKYDSDEQLLRRFNYIVYHWKDKDNIYRQFQIPMSEYKNYNDLKRRAGDDGFRPVKSNCPF